MRISFLLKKHFSFLLALCFWLSVGAQSPEEKTKDSLVNKIENQSGEEKLASLEYLCTNFYRKDPKLMLKYIDQGIALAQGFGKLKSVNNFYRRKGVSNSVLGNMEEALLNLNVSMTGAVHLKDTVQIAKSAHSLGSYYNRLGNYKAAEEQYLKAKTFAFKAGFLKTKYLAESNLATLYIHRGLHKKASFIYDELLEQCPNEDIDCNAALLNRALCTYMLGEPSKGLDMLFRAKAIDESRGNLVRVQYINHHIAYVLESVGLFEESIRYYDEVLKYFNTQGELQQQVAVNGTLGELLMKLNRNGEAKVHLLESLRLQKENGLKAFGRTLTSLGDLALVEKDLIKATTYYENAVPPLKEAKDKRGTVLLLLSKADLLIAKEDYQKAEERTRKALVIGKKLGLKQLQIDACKKLAIIYEKQERFEKALLARDTLKVLNIGFADKSTALEINQKLVRIKLLENEKKIVELEGIAQNENTSKKKISIIITTLFLIVLGSILYINRRKLWKSKFASYPIALDDAEAKELIASLEDVMQTQHPFLNEDLNLLQLAKLIPTTQKKLSILLNQYLKTNFNDYINMYRVAAFKSFLVNEDYKEYSMLGIASECGFKSKSSFYRIFKKETGQSPGLYKKQFLKETVS